MSINSGFAVLLDQDYRYNSELCAARFRLDNGLTIIFMPDRRAKLFAYQTWFRVGSRDENPDRTGLAHLFEHLMFKGTTTQEIREEAISNGMSTLYADGMLKVIRGITTFEEVYRVAKKTEQEALAFQHIVNDLDSL